MFAAISPRYDLLNRLLSLGIDRIWRRRTVDALAPGSGERWLDVCTGTGDLALAVAARLEGPARSGVYGVDFCPEMLRLGVRKASRRRGRGAPVEFLAADAVELPFPDRSFDGACVAFGLRNVERREAAIGEMRRVLRDGGRLGILEFTTPPRRWFRKLFGFYFHRILPRVGGWISGHPEGRQAYGYLPDSVARFPDAPALDELLRREGLVEVRHRLFSGGIAALHTARRPPREERESAPREISIAEEAES